ncbi:ISAs1 family transposase [Methylomonas koyamae]|nr:ISAs1 family transposase [Methylomonas koyamae]BBL57192.1 hypothetical protein MKFW12EY_08050 [Methylomonas koyamae]
MQQILSNLKADDHRRLAIAVRVHWSNLHWVLDVAFDEDRNRTRQNHSAANLAVIRHIALNLFKNETSRKVGIKVKRKRAGWDNDYLLRLIRGI